MSILYRRVRWGLDPLTVSELAIFFYMYKYIRFCEQERPEMDDFERKKKKFNIKKILGKKFLTDTLAKTWQTIFAYSFVSEHSKHFFCYFEKKKIVFFRGPP